MEKIIVTCKLITPLFMYGANDTPEIRATSIKGLLRFWWRTFNYCENPDLLKEQEAEIFGSTDQKAPINIKVNYEDLDTKILKRIDYLFYSLKDDDTKILKPYKLPNTDQLFNIEFSYTNREKNKKRKIFKEHYVKALKLMQVLGGLGSRNRRGAGNFIITNVKVVDDDNFGRELKEIIRFKPSLANFENELKEFLNSLILQKLDKAGEYPNIVGTGLSIYTFEYKNNTNNNHRKIRKFNNWIDALHELNRIYKNFRSREKLENFDHEALSVFGLPLFYGNPPRAYKFNIENETILNRLPSPLIFKICETAENKYIALIIRLSSELLDSYSEIYVNKEGEENMEKIELKNVDKRNLIDIFLENEEFIKLY